VHFRNKNKINITTTLVIEVLIEKTPGNWVEFRKVLASVTAELIFHFDYSKKGSKIINNSLIKSYYTIDSQVQDSEGNIKYNEKEKVQQFLNMNFGRIKYFLNKENEGRK